MNRFYLLGCMVLLFSFLGRAEVFMKLGLSDGDKAVLAVPDKFKITFQAPELVFESPDERVSYHIDRVAGITYLIDDYSTSVAEMEREEVIVSLDNERITITNNINEIRCRIFTLAGEEIESHGFKGNGQVELSRLSRGVYIVEIASGNNRNSSFKFIRK